MDFLDSIILGVIEGITEFLPISSTGHLILTEHILGIVPTEFVKSFGIAIQLGAILAVVMLYWRRLFLSKKIFSLVTVAFIPTAVVGFGLYTLIKNVWLGSNVVVLWALAIGGVVLIIFEWFIKPEKATIVSVEQMDYKLAVKVGLFQALAVVPGVSRAAATIVGGMIFKMSRSAIVEFSFLLAIPTMTAATGYDLLKSGVNFSSDQLGVFIVGFIVAFLVARLTVKWLLRFIEKHTFIGFGVYRIVLAILFALIFIV